jgi:hypothetical protein
MDRYDNVATQNTVEQEDEPFYCSPAYTEEDVICSGSDAEETAEEIAQKRARYEHHARRYLRGYLPVLQSASLRGPFTGWANPWRRVPSAKPDDWWQPGSEDMLFTRERVMTRAADHGLGYLGPTEALAWCKASAQAEAQQIHGVRDRPVEQDDQAGIGDTLAGLYGDESTEFPPASDELLALNSDLETPNEEQSMLNHHSGTPIISDLDSEATRGTKRPVDSQWLMGSYVSKRARWDGPTIATPTPQPEKGERCHRRHESFPKRNGSLNRTSRELSRLSSGLADIPSTHRRTDITFEPDTPNISLPNASQTSGTSRQNSGHETIFEQNSGLLQQEEEQVDELHEQSPESVFTSSPRNGSRKKSRRRSRRTADDSLLDMEQDDLNAATPHQHSSPSILPSSRFTNNGNLSSSSDKLPKHLRKIPERGNDRHAHNMDCEDEYSFITEVAPSSRDLEMFRYRKKRKRVELDTEKPDSNVFGLAVASDKSPRVSSPRDLGRLDKPQPNDLGQIEAEPDDKTKTTPDAEAPPIAKVDKKERSHHSDESWDFVDDAVEQPTLHSVEKGISAQTISMTRLSHTDCKSPIRIPQPMTSSQHSRLSHKSNQSSHQSQLLPDLRRGVSRPSAATRGMSYSQDPNDASTQSYNTSPPKPTLDPPSKPSSRSDPDNVQNEARALEDIQDVMEDVQKRLSQHSPRFMSPKMMQGGIFQTSVDGYQGELEARPFHGVPLDRRQAPRSSGLTSSSHTSVQGVEIEKACEVDAVIEPVTMGQAQRNQVQHTQYLPLQMLVRIESTEKEPESEAIPEITATRHTPYTEAGLLDIRRPEVETRTNSGEPARDVLRDESVMSGSLGAPREVEKSGSNTANFDSETSWEGCGPQSPWAAENLELPPVNAASKVYQNESLDGSASWVDCVHEDFSPRSGPDLEEQDGEHLERPQTPRGDIITPFKDLMSPTPVPQAAGSQMEGNGLLNTQSLVDAATNNPWTSNLRGPSSTKFKKRVSFGVLQYEEKENSPPNVSKNMKYSTRTPSSPPPPQHGSEDDDFDDGTPIVPKFIGHFVAARQFQHMLPQHQSSPPNSSARLSAQAEAFMAADREASAEQRRSTSAPKSPSRKLKSRRDRQGDSSRGRDRSLGSFQTNLKLPERNLMASFDMEDALGDMSDFLGDDWSVDAELKKAKESKEAESSRHRESNGYKRRKLFGLV